MVHLPAGTFQLSVPSWFIFAVRSTMSERGMIELAGVGAVGTDSYSKRKLKPAFSSQRLTRAPEWSTASISVYVFAGADGVWFITATGLSGAPVNSTR